MATGIIANTLLREGYASMFSCLFVFNIAAYVWLSLAMIWRLVRHRTALLADLIAPQKVFSFSAIVASTGVLGLSFDAGGYAGVALVLWALALALWVVLGYLGFVVLALGNGGADIIGGGWLIAVVATQSLVLLGVQIAPRLAEEAKPAFAFNHALWGVGLALYGIYVTLFAYRLLYFDVEPAEPSPLLWVVMGAAAITSNTGSELGAADTGAGFLNSSRPFIDAVTLISWAWATWWVPLLLLLGAWKHAWRRLPLAYTPQLWSVVFPVAMYALATRRLADDAALPALSTVSRVVIWIALALWLATMIALGLASWHSLRAFLRTNGAPASEHDTRSERAGRE
jgi:tellurite resistance protein TehA-like permease